MWTKFEQMGHLSKERDWNRSVLFLKLLSSQFWTNIDTAKYFFADDKYKVKDDLINWILCQEI